jgi:hypothetical protein
LVSYARQDWEKQHQASPYLEEAARLLGRSITPDAGATPATNAWKPPGPRPRRIERMAYTVSELATHRLCPYRFKMEVLTEWAGRYTDAWQLEWMARGIWLAETLHHVATLVPRPEGARQFEGAIEAALVTVGPLVRERLPGLRPLAWIGIESAVRGTVGYLLKTAAMKETPLVGVTIPHPRGKTWELVIGHDRHVRVTSEADFQVWRGRYLNFI